MAEACLLYESSATRSCTVCDWVWYMVVVVVLAAACTQSITVDVASYLLLYCTIHYKDAEYHRTTLLVSRTSNCSGYIFLSWAEHRTWQFGANKKERLVARDRRSTKYSSYPRILQRCLCVHSWKLLRLSQQLGEYPYNCWSGVFGFMDMLLVKHNKQADSKTEPYATRYVGVWEYFVASCAATLHVITMQMLYRWLMFWKVRSSRFVGSCCSRHTYHGYCCSAGFDRYA